MKKTLSEVWQLGLKQSLAPLDKARFLHWLNPFGPPGMSKADVDKQWRAYRGGVCAGRR